MKRKNNKHKPLEGVKVDDLFFFVRIYLKQNDEQQQSVVIVKAKNKNKNGRAPNNYKLMPWFAHYTNYLANGIKNTLSYIYA